MSSAITDAKLLFMPSRSRTSTFLNVSAAGVAVTTVGGGGGAMMGMDATGRRRSDIERERVSAAPCRCTKADLVRLFSTMLVLREGR